MALEEGKRFVDFKLKNQDGDTVQLDDFKGKWLVVYVYPKDDTPGCTIQGKSFTASKQDFDDANIAVVGVSEDDQLAFGCQHPHPHGVSLATVGMVGQHANAPIDRIPVFARGGYLISAYETAPHSTMRWSIWGTTSTWKSISEW